MAAALIFFSFQQLLHDLVQRSVGWSISSTFLMEWSTVVWCLPPNPGDFLERSAGELPDDVHCDLTWQGVTTT